MHQQRLLILGVVALAVMAGLQFFAPGEAPGTAPKGALQTLPVPQNHVASLEKRPVFPYSVVPGGTKDGVEAQTFASMDPTVGRHYADLELKRLAPVKLRKAESAYVSYRVGNRIYWTSKRLYLKEGESLLSDGSNFLRARCGNRISMVPMQPTLAKAEPSQAEFDLPNWDTPLFQAMVREANRPSDAPLFEFPRPAPQTFDKLTMNLPDSLFRVLPPLQSGGQSASPPSSGSSSGPSSGGSSGGSGATYLGGSTLGGFVFGSFNSDRPLLFQDQRASFTPPFFVPTAPGSVGFPNVDFLPDIFVPGNPTPLIPGLIVPIPITAYLPPVVYGNFPPGPGTFPEPVIPSTFPVTYTTPPTGPTTSTSPGGPSTPPDLPPITSSNPPPTSTGPSTSTAPPTSAPPQDTPFGPVIVPEPASFLLVPAAFALLYMKKRRDRSKNRIHRAANTEN